jgi:putative FmdB family regulatory protein
MPVYSCECQECGQKFEFYNRIVQLNMELRCPGCGSNRVTQSQITPWQDSELDEDVDESAVRESS